jgi:DNA polymerase III subunit beta
MISASRRQLTRALALASTVVERRNTIPALGCIKIMANGKLTLESTDLDTSARVEMPYDDGGKHADMAFLLPNSRRVAAAVNAAGGDDVRLAPTRADNRIFMAAGKLTSQLIIQEASSFPTVDAVEHEDFSATLGEAELRQIARVLPAISKEETRYYLNGICVRHMGNWVYRFAATDGHRLMQVDVPLPGAMGMIPDNIIIPAAWIRLVMVHFRKTRNGAIFRFGRKLARNEDNGPLLPVETPGGQRIAMTADLDGLTFTLTSKLIDGTYPDYQRVVPTGYTHLVRIERAKLVQAISALSGLSLERGRAVKLIFEPGEVHCQLHSPDLGESHFELPATHNMPNGAEVGMNGNYALQQLAAFTGAEIELHFNEQAGMYPILWRDPGDTAFLAVLMPMRI